MGAIATPGVDSYPSQSGTPLKYPRAATSAKQSIPRGGGDTNVNHDLAGMGRSLRGNDPGALDQAAALSAIDSLDDEPLLGAGAAIVLAVAFGALFWAAVYTLLF